MLTRNAARAPVLPVLHGITILCGVLPFENRTLRENERRQLQLHRQEAPLTVFYL